MMVKVDQCHDLFFLVDFIYQNKRSSDMYSPLILHGFLQWLKAVRVLQYFFHFLVYRQQQFSVILSKFLELSIQALLNRKFIHFPNHISC